jgi:CubicO group peptidase (beta-lactamase class C family)
MYNTAADVTGVLIARTTGKSFGDALRERICDPLGMTDTAFSVAGDSIGRLATAYERDNAATGEPLRWSPRPCHRESSRALGSGWSCRGRSAGMIGGLDGRRPSPSRECGRTTSVAWRRSCCQSLVRMTSCWVARVIAT